MGGDAYFKMYPDAWLGDTKLQLASASTRGGWANLLMYANDAPIRGILTGTDDQLRRMANLDPEEWEQFKTDATNAPDSRDNFCDLSRGNNGLITVKNRRMVREDRKREQGRERAARFRDSEKVTHEKRDNNAGITPSSTSKEPKETIPKTKKKKRREYPARFERLWKVHPKGGKAAAHNAMVKIAPDDSELERWIKALEASKATDQWRRGVSPNLSKWIREGYFDGEIPASTGETEDHDERKYRERIEQEMAERRARYRKDEEGAVPMPDDLYFEVEKLSNKLSVDPLEE